MHTVTECQRQLIALGYLAAGEDDGRFGEKSLAAYNRFRASKGLGPVVNTSMAELNAVLFPSPIPIKAPKGLNIMQATVLDYALNFLTSKIGWAAAAMVAVVVGWVSTKFGIEVPTDVQNQVTMLLVSGFGMLIAVLRTFFNSPKVAGKQPEIIKKL